MGWATALLQTTVIPGIIGGLLGLLFGLGLVLTAPDGILPHRGWFSFFDKPCRSSVHCRLSSSSR